MAERAGNSLSGVLGFGGHPAQKFEGNSTWHGFNGHQQRNDRADEGFGTESMGESMEESAS